MLLYFNAQLTIHYVGGSEINYVFNCKCRLKRFVFL